MNSAADIWEALKGLLKKELTPTTVELWMDDIEAVSYSQSGLVLVTPTAFKKDIITKQYGDALRKCMFQMMAMDIPVVILSGDEQLPEDAPAPMPGNEQFTFETFVVGNSNQMAYAAAEACAAEPGSKYNPLFIYGGSGLGKTHLLKAIGNRYGQKNPGKRIACVTGEQFTNELIAHIRGNNMEEFREKYRTVDMLLLDDVQFIGGKERTEEEFFHTFCTLTDAGKQIALVSDRTPNEIKHLSDRLRTRFEQGLIVDVQPPDYETRVAIIKNKAASCGVNIPDSIADYVASTLTDNVRELEGGVRKILAFQDIMGSNLDIDTVIRAIKEFVSTKEFAPTPEEIIEETAKFYGLKPTDITGESQAARESTARQVCMYLIQDYRNLPMKQIAAILGRDDHSTVSYGIKRIKKQISRHDEIEEVIRDIRNNLDSRR